jgi:ribosome maturation factor RimP
VPTFSVSGASSAVPNEHDAPGARFREAVTKPDVHLGRLRAAATRVAESHGLELFDLQYRRESIGWVLRVVIDRQPASGVDGPEDAVSIDDCRLVSQDLSALLDVEEDLAAGDQKYTLEVSSPGLDRPLRGEADYRRFVGRLAKIVTAEPIDGQSAFAGRLSGVEDAHVLLNEGRRVHRVPLASIRRARLDVEF